MNYSTVFVHTCNREFYPLRNIRGMIADTLQVFCYHNQVKNSLAVLAFFFYEKDKAGAAALLTDFRAVAAAGLRQSPHAPVQGIAAQRALRLAEAAIQRLGAQVNPKIVLSVFAAKFRAL